MGCPGSLHDATDMEFSAKPQEEKSIDWLDLEFWPESDFKVEAMQSNQTYDWVAQHGGSSEAQHMHSNHHQPPSVPQQHHQSTANGAPLARFVQPREEESMPIIEAVRILRATRPPYRYLQEYSSCRHGLRTAALTDMGCYRKSKPSCLALSLGKARTWACHMWGWSHRNHTITWHPRSWTNETFSTDQLSPLGAALRHMVIPCLLLCWRCPTHFLYI